MDLFAVEEFEDPSEGTEKKEAAPDEWQDLVENLQKETQSKLKPKKMQSLPVEGKPLGFLLNNLVELVKHYGVVEEFHLFTPTQLDRLSTTFLTRIGINITTRKFFGTIIITELIRICTNEKQPFVLFMATHDRDYMRALSRITLTGNHTILIADLRENHHFRITKATSEVVDWNDFLPLPEASANEEREGTSVMEDPYNKPQTFTQELLSMRSWWDDEDEEKPLKRKNQKNKPTDNNKNSNNHSTNGQPAKKQKTDKGSKQSGNKSKDEVIPLEAKKAKKAALNSKPLNSKPLNSKLLDSTTAPDKKILYQGLWKDVVESLQQFLQAPKIASIRQYLTKALSEVPSHVLQLYGIKAKLQPKDTANLIWKDFESFLNQECQLDNRYSEKVYWPSSGEFVCTDLADVNES